VDSPILHVGYHKTGSSWLQEQFFKNARDVAVVARQDIRRCLLVPSPGAFDPNVARAELFAGRRGRLVVSDEELSGNLHSGGLHGAFSLELAERLHRCLPEGRVVIVVRNQLTMIAAAYKQYIKSGGTRRIEGFLEPAKAPHKTPRFSLDFLCYDQLVGRYEELFGPERVTVALYEHLAAAPIDFAARLAKGLDLDVDLSVISPRPVNVGYRSRTLRVVRFLNLFHTREMPNAPSILNLPGWHTLLRVLAPHLDRIPLMGRALGIEELLPSQVIRGLEDHFRESNGRLEAARQLGLREAGYPVR
jgi:hypothetical protein